MSSVIDIQRPYAELSDGDSALLLDLKQVIDLPSGVLEFTNLKPGEDCIVKMVGDDTKFSMTSREKYIAIANVTAPVFNRYLTYSSVAGSIPISVDVSDYSGRVVTIAYLYWLSDPNNELDSY